MAVPSRVTASLVGGLGNQLFIVANLLAVSERCGIPAVLPRVPFSSSHGPPRPVYWRSVFAGLRVATATGPEGTATGAFGAFGAGAEGTAGATGPEGTATGAFGAFGAGAEGTAGAAGAEGTAGAFGAGPEGTAGAAGAEGTAGAFGAGAEGTAGAFGAFGAGAEGRVATAGAVALPAGLPERVVPEPSPAAPIRLDPSQRCVYRLVGFFQSHAFFADAAEAQRIVPEALRERAARHLGENYGAGHRVGLHVRRGDYMQMRDVFEILEVDYYDAAVRQLLGKQIYAGGVKLIIFCEETREGETIAGYFRSKYAGLEVAFVCAENESVPLQCDSSMPREVLEMLMLAECEDVVMANSSWSWWAAYLNRSPLRRVVAPSRWFVAHPYPHSNRLYCDDWILL